jgi:hypothetical protein
MDPVKVEFEVADLISRKEWTNLSQRLIGMAEEFVTQESQHVVLVQLLSTVHLWNR